MSVRPLRVLVVEDEVLVAAELAWLVEDLGHEVVGEAATSGEALRLAAETSPDLVASVMNAGNLDDVWAGLQRYFEAGCTRVIVAAYARGRVDIERLIDALAPKLRSGVATRA